MINIEKRLKEELTVVKLLGLILSVPKDLNGKIGYIIIPNDTLSRASRTSADTISYCKEHDFIQVIPSGSKCHEFHIMEKGVAFFNSRPSKEKLAAGFSELRKDYYQIM